MNPEEPKPEYWHRIDFTRYAPPVDDFGYSNGHGSIGLNHHRYKVLKTTAKGVWLDMGCHGLLDPEKRFVLFDSKRQFASPTFEQAKDKFCLRKRRQIEILRSQIRDIEIAISKIETFKPRDDNYDIQGWIG